MRHYSYQIFGEWSMRKLERKSILRSFPMMPLSTSTSFELNSTTCLTLTFSTSSKVMQNTNSLCPFSLISLNFEKRRFLNRSANLYSIVTGSEC